MAKSTKASTDTRVLEETAELLTVPPAEFVAARNALVKQLKSQGDGERAGVVAKLRRPSATTWAVNAATRSDEAAAVKLVETVRALQTPGSIDVRATTKQLDLSLDALVEAGAAALEQIGTTPTADRRAELRTALRIAALAEDPTPLLQARILDVDAADPDDTLAAALRAGAHGAGRRTSTSAASTPRTRRPSALRTLTAAVNDAKATLKDAESALRTAERDVRRIERELADARRQADACREAVDDAKQLVEERQAELDDARAD